MEDRMGANETSGPSCHPLLERRKGYFKKLFVFVIISLLFAIAGFSTFSSYDMISGESVPLPEENLLLKTYRSRRSILADAHSGSDDAEPMSFNSLQEYGPEVSAYFVNRHKSNSKRRVKKVLASKEYWEMLDERNHNPHLQK